MSKSARALLLVECVNDSTKIERIKLNQQISSDILILFRPSKTAMTSIYRSSWWALDKKITSIISMELITKYIGTHIYSLCFLWIKRIFIHLFYYIIE